MGSIPVANPAPYQRPHFSRRGLLVLALPLALIALIVMVVAFAWPTGPRAQPERWVDAGAVDSLVVNEPVRVIEYRLWLVKLESRKVLALSRRDPRNGCTIPWRPDFEFAGRKGWFRDPCHGSTYDIDGSLVFGPSPRDMDRYRVEIRDGQIFVDLSELYCGANAPVAQGFCPTLVGPAASGR